MRAQFSCLKQDIDYFQLEERQLGIEKRRASLKRPVEIIEID
jgi:hypothetical protein